MGRAEGNQRKVPRSFRNGNSIAYCGHKAGEEEVDTPFHTEVGLAHKHIELGLPEQPASAPSAVASERHTPGDAESRAGQYAPGGAFGGERPRRDERRMYGRKVPVQGSWACKKGQLGLVGGVGRGVVGHAGGFGCDGGGVGQQRLVEPVVGLVVGPAAAGLVGSGRRMLGRGRGRNR